MPCTFVSAYLNFHEERIAEWTHDEVVLQFLQFASTGVYMHIFMSPDFICRYAYCFVPYPNVYIEEASIDSLECIKLLEGISYDLPLVRAGNKDTEKYMLLMNEKICLIKRAMNAAKWGTTHYAWLDFRIGRIIHNWPLSLQIIQQIGWLPLQSNMLMFPGCWEKGMGVDRLFRQINWRFCGGFFIGDAESLTDMYMRFCRDFPRIVAEHGCLPWEVNIWHTMELTTDWTPTWFLANHDDTILQIPSSAFLLWKYNW